MISYVDIMISYVIRRLYDIILLWCWHDINESVPKVYLTQFFISVRPHRSGLVWFPCFSERLEELKQMPKSWEPMFFSSVQNELYQYLRRPASSIQVSCHKILAFFAVYQCHWFRRMCALFFLESASDTGIQSCKFLDAQISNLMQAKCDHTF